MTERGPLGAGGLNDAQRAALRGSRFTAEELETLREEARRRWGGSDTWRQSEERTNRHTDQDWDDIRGRWDADMRAIVADMPKGIGSPQVQGHIAGYRDWLRNFYEPNDDIFRGLATMFVDDDRYAGTFRRYHPDLPVFLRDAMLYSLGDRP